MHLCTTHLSEHMPLTTNTSSARFPIFFNVVKSIINLFFLRVFDEIKRTLLLFLDLGHFHVCQWGYLRSTAQELSRRCRQLIVDHSTWYNNTTESWHPMPCIHGDLTSILPDHSFDPESSFMTRLYDINRAPLYSHQFCYTHNRDCALGVLDSDHDNRPDYDFSGLPCPDMSPAGKKKREEGTTSSVFLCHAKYHVAMQTPILIIENVPDSGCSKKLNVAQTYFLIGQTWSTSG